MKSKVYAILAASLAVAGMLASCSEKDDDTFGAGGPYVDFTVGSADTRTVRSDDNKYQINWADGDQVRVYCNQCITSKGTQSTGGVAYADYTVNKDASDPSKGKLQYTEDGLQWQESKATDTHRFYAVYPSSASTNMDNGVATFKLVTNQVAKVSSKQEITVSSNTSGESRYAYTCAPDMSLAYMVAYAQTSGTGVKVPMDFSPIMTTLDVTVENKQNENETDAMMTLTGLTITDEAADYVQGTDGDEFKCSISKNGAKLQTGTTSTKQIYYVDIQDAEGNHFLDLQVGEKVTFTVFLPPIAVNDKDGGHKLTLQVRSTGGAPKAVTLGGTADKNSKVPSFAASSLGNVKLNIKRGDSNDWITPLDSTIYVQQLSIPGTNEAISYLASGDAKKQTYNIRQQLAMGIRAFDVHVSRSGLSSSYNLYAGDTLDDEKMENGVEQGVSNFFTLIREFLTAHNKEFVVVFFTSHSSWTDFDERLKRDLVNNKTASGEPFIVQWKNNLTIDECRGKVVVMMREVNVASRAGSYAAYTTETFSVTNENSSNLKTLNLYVNGGSTRAGFINYFARNSGSSDYTSDAETRFGYVEKVLDQAKSDETGFPWSLCYIAGATKTGSTTKGYAENAEKMHPLFFNWENEQTTFGPFGIIFMDFVGPRTLTVDSKPYTIYGDLLPQAIIDNNYRFTMKRASGTTGN